MKKIMLLGFVGLVSVLVSACTAGQAAVVTPIIQTGCTILFYALDPAVAPLCTDVPEIEAAIASLLASGKTSVSPDMSAADAVKARNVEVYNEILRLRTLSGSKKK